LSLSPVIPETPDAAKLDIPPFARPPNPPPKPPPKVPPNPVLLPPSPPVLELPKTDFPDDEKAAKPPSEGFVLGGPPKIGGVDLMLEACEPNDEGDFEPPRAPSGED